MSHYRPTFGVAWILSQKIYQANSPETKVAQVIGGQVAHNITMPNGWTNTCAVRMSYILNHSGVIIPYSGKKTVSGADNNWYFYRVKDLIDFLNYRWGKPEAIVPYPLFNNDKIKSKKGVILFEIAGWTDAGGHATLWNGSMCYDHCYFYNAHAAYHTNQANFWSLQ